MASDSVSEHISFCTYTLISLAMGCFSILALTDISNSQLMYPSTSSH